MKNELKTLSDAIRYFDDEQVCIDTVAGMRWPDGPQCPACLMPDTRQHWLKTQRRWQCRDCGKQYSVKVNTIFEDSAIKLDKWLTAMWLLANCKNGISSYEIAKDIGVTQKSAWFMLQRIRLAMKNGSVLKLGGTGGPVEVDETFIGGKPKNMHAAKRLKMKTAIDGYAEKAIVVGMLDRDTRQVRAQVIPNVKRETLQNQILNGIERKSTVYTDGYHAYDGLKVRDFVHRSEEHT